MKFDEAGTLVVRVYTAGGALPLKNTRIHIVGATEENRFFVSDLTTDADGLSTKISLPAPSKKYSLSPSPAEIPYSTYDIVVSADGYYTKQIYGVSIFSGIDSVQPVAMIPIVEGENVYPRESLNIYIKENERLE